MKQNSVHNGSSGDISNGRKDFIDGTSVELFAKSVYYNLIDKEIRLAFYKGEKIEVSCSSVFLLDK